MPSICATEGMFPAPKAAAGEGRARRTRHDIKINEPKLMEDAIFAKVAVVNIDQTEMLFNMGCRGVSLYQSVE